MALSRIGLSLCATVMVAVVPGWTHEKKPSSSHLMQRCSHGDDAACRELAGIVMHSRNADLRTAALAVLTDQTLLSQIASQPYSADRADLMSEDGKIRLAATDKISDQRILASLAVESGDCAVSRLAVRRLSDQSLLTQIATGQNSGPTNLCDVREAAVRALKDETLLAKLAIEDTRWTVAEAAAQTLTDQYLLAKVASEGGEFAARAAVRRLNDQDLLARLAVQHKTASVRYAAAGTITDRDLLRSVVSVTSDTRMRVVADIRDMIAVTTVFAQPVSISVDIWPISQTYWSPAGFDVVKGEQVYVSILSKTGDLLRDKQWQTSFPTNVSRGTTFLAVSLDLTDLFDDQIQLTQIATRASGSTIRCGATRKLTNRQTLAQIEDDPDPTVSLAAKQHLQELLTSPNSK